MGEHQIIEKLLEKMTQLLKEIEKLRQSKKSGNSKAKWKNNGPRKSCTYKIRYLKSGYYVKWNFLFTLDTIFGSVSTCPLIL
jgi:hypothetical protein